MSHGPPSEQESNTGPDVDVVVPTYNAADLVATCVERLAEDPRVASIVVVDDDSSDGTVERMRAKSRVALVGLSAHRGLAHAYNAGWKRTSAPLVLFLNNDVLASEHAVTQLARALDADPEAVASAGRLVDQGTHRTQSSYLPRAIPGATGLLARVTGLERAWPRNPLTGAHLRAPLPEDRVSRTPRQPAGACLLVRREVLDVIGGWDERFSIWYEDVDISRRLNAYGPTLFVPDSLFEHVGGASTGSWTKADQHRRLYHGALVYSWTHFGRLARFTVGVAYGIASAVRVLPLALIRRPTQARVYARLARASFGLAAGRAPDRLASHTRR